MRAPAARRAALDERVLTHAQTTPLLPRWLFTLDGWNSHVREKVERPDLATCSPAGFPLSHDDRRLVYNSHLRLVLYPKFEQALLHAFHTFKANRHRSEGFLDRVIDGPAGTGKSYLLRAIGREYQAWVEGEDLSRATPSVIPVVHITVPYDSDGKVNWIWEIAHFLGLNPPPKDDQALWDQRRLPDMSIPVTHVLERAQTRMFLIDDIQRTNADQLGPALHYFDYLRTKFGIGTIFCGTGATDIIQAARVKADKLRDATTGLKERVNKDRVKAGASADLPKEQPVRSALPVTWLDPLQCHTASEQEVWLKVLKGFEDNLCLHHLSEHALTKHAEYLHKRTGGHFKHLSHLVCQAAIDAMEQGDEDITLERLARIHVGHNDDA
ncbi:ATP-binding protein [Kitasatospora sp. NPDC093558]|uniref:ATP-binding protein n=1 Tax=Kitasatospora sp. NPDC093558 TaxID=3155201 RepID=UPI00343EEAF9